MSSKDLKIIIIAYIILVLILAGAFVKIRKLEKENEEINTQITTMQTEINILKNRKININFDFTGKKDINGYSINE